MSGGYIERVVVVGCEKIAVGNVHGGLVSKVAVIVTVMGFDSSSMMYGAMFTVVVAP